MSDSLPPDGGPGPWDGWDLEGMLSGEPVWLPEGMRPVASTLAALRSAPVPAELAGETAARAMFRQLISAGSTEPAPPPVRPVDVDSRTLILPAPTADAGPRVVTRPRHAHRRPPRRGRLRPAVLIGAAGGAAAIVIAGGIALAGGFSGGGQPGLAARNAAASSAAPSKSHPALGGVEGSGTKAATVSPTPSGSNRQQSSSGSNPNSGPTALCRQYLDFIAHPGSRSDGAAESADLQQLSGLAGGEWRVVGYCLRLQPWSKQSDSGDFGSPPYSQYSSNGGGGSQGQDKSGFPQPGDNGNGGGSGGSGGQGNAGNGNGNGQGANGPGFGGQNQN